MVNAELISALVILAVMIGLFWGSIISFIKNWLIKRKARKFDKEKAEKGLKPCLICQKWTTGDVCSPEHQQQWIKLHTLKSEGKQEPKKEEDFAGKEESSDKLSSSSKK